MSVLMESRIHSGNPELILENSTGTEDPRVVYSNSTIYSGKINEESKI